MPRDGVRLQEMARQPLLGLRSEEEESVGCASLCAGPRSGDWLLGDISNGCVKSFSFEQPGRVRCAHFTSLYFEAALSHLFYCICILKTRTSFNPKGISSVSM